MTRTFTYSFDPPTSSPIVGTTVDLDVSDIEDAGVREVLQTPGAPYGSWSILDALLAATGPGTPFVFQEPLGHAREVKVALSGLFGRFVARAYLERYFGLKIFAHLSRSSLLLDRRLGIKIVKLDRGDLPDWVASTSTLSTLTVAEAKGCHDRTGPAKALARAWDQANRIDVIANGKRVTVKRIAVATRWGAASAGPSDSHLSVRDPEDQGDPVTPQESDATYIGILRQHVANLIAPLGHSELASLIRQLNTALSPRAAERGIAQARHVLDTTSVKEVVGGHQVDGLIGGIVTRAGPLRGAEVAMTDQDALARLNLRPVFVGIERDLVTSAIDGEAEVARKRMTDISRRDDVARYDQAGGWIVPLGQDQRFIRDV